MAEENPDQPQLHVDTDWKAQAQKEKEKLRQQAQQQKASQQASQEGEGGQAGGEQAAPQGGMPPASFQTLVSSLATQALFAMGAIADPRSGERYQNMDLARHHIDMLGVLEEKTKGNLSEEEQTTLATTLYELRTRYVQAAAQQRSV